MGRGTDLAALATTAEAAIPSASTVAAGGTRTLPPEVLASALAGVGGGGLTGVVAAPVGTAIMRQMLMNDLMQRYLRNQAVGPPTATGMTSMAPGLLSD